MQWSSLWELTWPKPDRLRPCAPGCDEPGHSITSTITQAKTRPASVHEQTIRHIQIERIPYSQPSSSKNISVMKRYKATNYRQLIIPDWLLGWGLREGREQHWEERQRLTMDSLLGSSYESMRNFPDVITDLWLCKTMYLFLEIHDD